MKEGAQRSLNAIFTGLGAGAQTYYGIKREQRVDQENRQFQQQHLNYLKERADSEDAFRQRSLDVSEGHYRDQQGEIARHNREMEEANQEHNRALYDPGHWQEGEEIRSPFDTTYGPMPDLHWYKEQGIEPPQYPYERGTERVRRDAELKRAEGLNFERKARGLKELIGASGGTQTGPVGRLAQKDQLQADEYDNILNEIEGQGGYGEPSNSVDTVNTPGMIYGQNELGQVMGPQNPLGEKDPMDFMHELYNSDPEFAKTLNSRLGIKNAFDLKRVAARSSRIARPEPQNGMEGLKGILQGLMGGGQQMPTTGGGTMIQPSLPPQMPETNSYAAPHETGAGKQLPQYQALQNGQDTSLLSSTMPIIQKIGSNQPIEGQEFQTLLQAYHNTYDEEAKSELQWALREVAKRAQTSGGLRALMPGMYPTQTPVDWWNPPEAPDYSPGGMIEHGDELQNLMSMYPEIFQNAQK